MAKQPMKQDIKLDACIVHAAMRGMLVPFGIQTGMKPDELYARCEWIRQQSPSYIKKVSNRVVQMEAKGKKRG